jgi:uncharacterized repeat protein (TIGR04076 family)
MSYEMAKCKITVIKRMIHQDLADQFLADEDKANFKVCDLLKEGQEFICEHPFHLPAGFPCAGAWADIKDSIITVSAGMELPWIKQRHTTIAVCKDWFKPVYFKIEKIL